MARDLNGFVIVAEVTPNDQTVFMPPTLKQLKDVAEEAGTWITGANGGQSRLTIKHLREYNWQAALITELHN
ncbi:hypothetical protein N7513_003582 [Penicillium frequentans]|nr:hypothetical protein N7513_003582 [Penicillium glabrum]